MRQAATRALKLVPGHAAPGGCLRVAFATSGARMADESFGRAPTFSIYDVAADGADLVGIVEFDPVTPPCRAANDNPDDCPDRVGARLLALAGCHVLFARAIGDAAASRALGHDIHPLVVPRDEPISTLIGRCMAMLGSNPPPWVRRIVGGTGIERPGGEPGAEGTR